MATVQVRYIVNDVDAAIAFYCEQLGFHEDMHPAPPFAMLSRGDLRLVLSQPGGGPGGGQAMPDGTLPQPAEYRMWGTPLSPGRWVHMLEHGAVAVLYRPDLCDSACVQQLGQVYDNAPKSSLVGVRHLVITPYQDMDHAIAVVAWGYQDEMDQVDTDRVMADYKSKVDATTAPERGAL